MEHDRDINSAKNILQQAGLQLGIDSTESKRSALNYVIIPFVIKAVRILFNKVIIACAWANVYPH